MTKISQYFTGFKVYFTKQQLIIGLLGFSSGLPLLLTLSTLSWWLAKEGIDKKTIGLFALAGLPYTWKFIWAPFVDRLSLPFLTKALGRRRSWMLFTQICLAACIFILGRSNPLLDIEVMAWWTLAVAFWSATQDIVVDAYRIESLEKSEYAAGGAMEQLGYRLGMMVAGAGALALSDTYSWETIYALMAACVGIGIITTLCAPEPQGEASTKQKTKASMREWINDGIIGPFKDFMQKKGWAVLLIFIMIYRLGDNIIGQMSTVFYQELGFTGTEVGSASKFFGMWMTILGTLFIGSLSYRIDLMKALLVSGLFHALSNLMFLVLAKVGHSVPVLYLSVALENISGGMMAGAAVAYLSTLCSLHYTATQYALLSSFAAQGRVLFQSTSGYLASHLGWEEFFTVATGLSFLPLFLLLYIQKIYPLEKSSS
jgi:PAT family beta-lactamase induction signal transducer AmpG